MSRSRAATLSLALLVSAGVCESGEDLEIGIVDFYGLGRVSESEARGALTVKEGDTVQQMGNEPPAFMAESERRLSALAGVARAHVQPVCCEAGRWIVYVGLEEPGRATTNLRPAPRANARLAPEVVAAGKDLSEVRFAAVQRGDAAEDDSQGHALSHDPASRAIQERFVGYAGRDLKGLRRVLRESRDAEQRALAAEVLGYASDKQGVVDDLVYGMSDPDANVRNNSMRALAVFSAMAPTAGRPRVQIPAEPFIRLLNSSIWTDRNKSSLALMRLTAGRDARLLARLRREAWTSLVEMARWKSLGHAQAALTILWRIGGMSDEAIAAAVERGDRQGLIAAPLPRH